MKKRALFVTLPLLAASILLVIGGGAYALAQAPTPAPVPTPVLKVGMSIGERYHDIHVNRLQLKCERCHTVAEETYNDPLAQAFNPADRRACLSCHAEGSALPFYGEGWAKAKVEAPGLLLPKTGRR